MVTVEIKNSRWAAPVSTNAESSLLQAEGKRMCCLGFCAREAGYSASEIRGKSFPNELDNSLRWRTMFPKLTNIMAIKLAEVNDNCKISRKERAKEIQEIGASIGVNFVFVP